MDSDSDGDFGLALGHDIPPPLPEAEDNDLGLSVGSPASDDGVPVVRVRQTRLLPSSGSFGSWVVSGSSDAPLGERGVVAFADARWSVEDPAANALDAAPYAGSRPIYGRSVGGVQLWGFYDMSCSIFGVLAQMFPWMMVLMWMVRLCYSI